MNIHNAYIFRLEGCLGLGHRNGGCDQWLGLAGLHQHNPDQRVIRREAGRWQFVHGIQYRHHLEVHP